MTNNKLDMVLFIGDSQLSDFKYQDLDLHSVEIKESNIVPETGTPCTSIVTRQVDDLSIDLELRGQVATVGEHSFTIHFTEVGMDTVTHLNNLITAWGKLR